MEKLISQGAEAKIYLDKTKKFVIKDRVPKSYRIKILDDKIRKSRTKSEAKLLERASQIINVPLPLTNSLFGRTGKSGEDNFKITLPFIGGKKLSQHLEEFPPEKQKQILKQIGKDVAKLHDAGIIHGDLTTSNMILAEENYNKKNNSNLNNKKRLATNLEEKERISVNHEQGEPIIFFIDFGLGFFNGKFEDKAVDLHLLKQALEAKHFSHWQENYNSFLEGYKNSKDYEKTINQLIKVEKRGRYKQ